MMFRLAQLDPLSIRSLRVVVVVINIIVVAVVVITHAAPLAVGTA